MSPFSPVFHTVVTVSIGERLFQGGGEGVGGGGNLPYN